MKTNLSHLSATGLIAADLVADLERARPQADADPKSQKKADEALRKKADSVVMRLFRLRENFTRRRRRLTLLQFAISIVLILSINNIDISLNIPGTLYNTAVIASNTRDLLLYILIGICPFTAKYATMDFILLRIIDDLINKSSKSSMIDKISFSDTGFKFFDVFFRLKYASAYKYIFNSFFYFIKHFEIFIETAPYILIFYIIIKYPQTSYLPDSIWLRLTIAFLVLMFLFFVVASRYLRVFSIPSATSSVAHRPSVNE